MNIISKRKIFAHLVTVKFSPLNVEPSSNREANRKSPYIYVKRRQNMDIYQRTLRLWRPEMRNVCDHTMRSMFLEG